MTLQQPQLTLDAADPERLLNTTASRLSNHLSHHDVWTNPGLLWAISACQAGKFELKRLPGMPCLS